MIITTLKEVVTAKVEEGTTLTTAVETTNEVDTTIAVVGKAATVAITILATAKAVITTLGNNIIAHLAITTSRIITATPTIINIISKIVATIKATV